MNPKISGSLPLLTAHCSLLTVLCLCVSLGAPNLFADDFPEATGDTAIAERYLEWAESAIGRGEWQQARAALERAMDFANVSSDIPYLLALARSHANENRGLVLQPLELAIRTGQWLHYTEAQARLLEADQLITLRRYTAALETLAVCQTLAGETADVVLLRLAALKGLINTENESTLKDSRHSGEFRRQMFDALQRYPRDPRPLRMLFEYALALKDSGNDTTQEDVTLVETAIRRLPFVVESDPELAWMAASFVSHVAEARRLVAAYRSGSFKPHVGGNFRPSAASIVPALNLGLLDDTGAADELFAETILEKKIIVDIANLLRSEEGRNYFAQKLHTFTGSIIEDEDRDGYPESRAVYRQGSLQEYYSDTDQDGITDLYVVFIAGNPQWAELATLPIQGEGRTQALIFWERYPAVQRTELENEVFRAVPGRFQFSPIIFEELGASDTYAGLVFPRINPHSPGLNRRMLASFAIAVQRPSVEFAGGIEHILFDQGIPFRAEVTLHGQLVSVTEFEDGYPLVQYLDMDLDGRMETVRRFDKNVLKSITSDWFGDGRFSSAELYQKDGSVVYSLDLDGDGLREYEK